MESRRISTDPDPFHFRNRGQPDWFCREKDHERAGNQAGLDLGHRLYFTNVHHLAADGPAGKYPLRSVSFFPPLYPETGRKDGNREEKVRG